MSAEFQSYAALLVVGLAGLFLLRSWWRRKKAPGCGGACGAVSPEVRKLQANLKK